MRTLDFSKKPNGDDSNNKDNNATPLSGEQQPAFEDPLSNGDLLSLFFDKNRPVRKNGLQWPWHPF